MGTCLYAAAWKTISVEFGEQGADTFVIANIHYPKFQLGANLAVRQIQSGEKESRLVLVEANQPGRTGTDDLPA